MNRNCIILTSSERILKRLLKNGIQARIISTELSANEIGGYLLKADTVLIYIGSPLENFSDFAQQLDDKLILWAYFDGDKELGHRNLNILEIDPDLLRIVEDICEEFGL